MTSEEIVWVWVNNKQIVSGKRGRDDIHVQSAVREENDASDASENDASDASENDASDASENDASDASFLSLDNDNRVRRVEIETFERVQV